MEVISLDEHALLWFSDKLIDSCLFKSAIVWINKADTNMAAAH